MFGFKEINETNEARQNSTVTTTVTTKEKDRFELPPIESLPPVYSLPPIEELLPLLEPVNKE